MANDAHSSHKARDDGYINERQTNEKEPINSGSYVSGTAGLGRSARETSSKKMIASPSSTQNSEKLEKRTSPTLAVTRSPKQIEKQNASSPLRRSLRTMGHSSLTSLESKSLGSPDSRHKMLRKDMSVKQMIEDKEVSENKKHDVIDVGTSQVKSKRMTARDFRAMFKMKSKTEYQKQLDSGDELTKEGRNNDGGKRNKSFKGSHVEFIGNVAEPYSCMSKSVEESLKENCAEAASSSRKDGVIDEAKIAKNLDYKEASRNITQNLHLDVSARIANKDNCNLIADASSSRSCECQTDGTLGTCGTCSNWISGSSQRKRKRIQHFGGSVNRLDIESDDVLKRHRKGNNDVHKPSSRTEDEGKLFTGNMEGNYENPVGNVSQLLPERIQGNEFESEKVRKLRNEQRSLHLSLKPTIAKLCEVLHLPDNVKSMVDNFLEYVMKNHQVHRDPVSILQAFQLSLCWTAASLLKHKIDHKASLKLAKQHLNFDCKKEEADYIYSMLRCLKKVFLYRTGNFCINLSPKASESSNRLDSCTGVVLEVELAKLDISKSKKEIQKKCQKQLRKLLVKQQQEKEKLNASHEEERAALERQYEIKPTHSIPNDATGTEKPKILNDEYAKKIEALKCRHEKHLKDLECVQLAARRKFEDKEAIWVQEVESWVQMELSHMSPSKELRVEYFQTSEKLQPQDGPKNVGDLVADRVGCDKAVEARTRTRVGLSVAPEIISNVLCGKPVELQTTLVKHASTDEMATTASGGGLISKTEDHYRAENMCDSQVNITSMHSHSNEENPDGPLGMTSIGEGNENFSSGGCRMDTMTLVLPSSGKDMCDGAMSVAPRGELDVEVQESGCSTDGLDEIPTFRRQILDGSMSRVPACGLLSGEVDATDSGAGVKNIASLDSQSSEENIQTGTARCMPNSKNEARTDEFDDSCISNNAVTSNSLLSEERIADRPSINVMDKEASLQMPGTGNFTDCPVNDVPVNPSLSVEHISDGSAMKVVDRVVPSRLCEPASPNDGRNTIGLSNSPLSEQQIPVEGSLSTPDVQAAGAMRQNSPEIAEFHNGTECQTDAILFDKTTKSDLQGVSKTMDENDLLQETLALRSLSPVVPPSVISSQANAISVNEALQGPCTSSISSSRMVGDGATVEEMQDSNQHVELVYNPVNIVPENQFNHDSHSLETPEEGQLLPSAESPLSHDIAGVLHDSSQQVDLESSSVDVPANRSNYELRAVEPLEQGQHLLSAQCPSNRDAPGEMLDSPQQDEPVSSPVDFALVNNSNHESLVTVPVEQVQQLPTAQSTSSNQDPSTTTLPDRIEQQSTIENSLFCHVPEASIAVPNQHVQPISNSEHDLHAWAGMFGTQSSDTRNMSTSSATNSYPTETVSWPLSRRPLPMNSDPKSDPLHIELERIHREAEQTLKNHENMKLQLKSDCEKEIEEIINKYETKLKQFVDEFQLRKKNLDNSFNIVFMNKVLADAFRCKCTDLKVGGASGMQQDASFALQPAQLPRQQRTVRPNLVSGISSPGIPATSLQSTSTTVNSQTMVPPGQLGFNTSGIIPGAPTGPPHLNSIAPPTRSIQVGSEIRAPAPHLQLYRPPTPALAASALAPHLQPYRPPTPAPAASGPAPHLQPRPPTPAPAVIAPLHGMSSQQVPNDIPTSSASLPHLIPQSTVPTYQSEPHNRVRLSENARGLPVHNLSATGLRADANSQYGMHVTNVMQRMLDAAVLNQSQLNVSTSMRANSGNQSTSLDVVCLSDDD